MSKWLVIYTKFIIYTKIPDYIEKKQQLMYTIKRSQWASRNEMVQYVSIIKWYCV